MHLEQQTEALYKARDVVKRLRVLHTSNTQKAGERVYNESLQPWQHNLIKTCNGIPALFNSLKNKYEVDSVPSTKFNSVQLKISISGRNTQILINLKWVSNTSITRNREKILRLI